MARNRRLWKEPPPENVLLEFCRQMPRVRVEGERIISDPPRDWRKSLTGVEAKLVERAQGARPGDGTRRDGGPLRGRRHEPLQLPRLRLLVAGDRAVRPQRLRAAGRRGAAARRSTALVASPARQTRVATACWTATAGPRTARSGSRYRLSKAASTYAVITVPAALKKVIQRPVHALATDGQRDRHAGHQGRPRLGPGRVPAAARARIGDHDRRDARSDQRTAGLDWATADVLGPDRA